MPTFVVPHRSGAHRVAAIALYRALLTQCKRTPLPAVHGEELYNLVKNRFRGFRHDTSHRHLQVAFEAGYEAVDYLDAAINGEVKAKDYILALLKRAPRNAKIDPRESPKQFLRRHYGSQAWPDHALSEEREGPPTGHESDWSAPAEAQEMNQSAYEPFSKDTASFEGSSKSFEKPANLEHGPIENENGSHSTSDDPAIRLVRSPLSEDERLSQAIFGCPPSEVSWSFRKHTLKSFRKQILKDAKDQSPPVPKRNILSDPPIAKEDLGGTGKRHVPVLVSANGIPFLRYKKPMPANLASFINSRIEQRDRRHRYRQELEQMLSLAHEEDKWDAIIYNTTGVDSREDGGDKVLWRHSAQSGLQQVIELLQAEKEKNRIHAEKMQAIVDREAELAKLEMEEEESKSLGGIMDDITDQEALGDDRGQEAGLPIRWGGIGKCWQPKRFR